MNIEHAEFRLSQGLQKLSSAVSEESADSIANAFFPQLDSVIRSDSKKLNSVMNATLDAARSIFQVRTSLNEDLDSKSSIKLLRDMVQKKVPEANLSEVNFEGMNFAIESGLKEKPPAPSSGELDAQTVTNDEIAELTEDNADNSADLANTLKPVVDKLHKAVHKNETQIFDEIFKIFDELKGKEGNFDRKELKEVKAELNKVMLEYTPEKLKAFLESQKQEIQFELAQYVKTVAAPLAAGGQGIMVAQGVKKGMQAKLLNHLNNFQSTLANRPDSITTEDVQIIMDKRQKIAQSIILITKEAEARLKNDPNYNVDAHLKNELKRINQVILDQFGPDVQIYKDDIEVITSHLENTKNISKEKQQSDIQAFVNQYGKYALMALPVVLGPLANMISRIPLVGRTVAGFVPLLNDIAKSSIAPMIMMGAVNSGNNSDHNAIAA